MDRPHGALVEKVEGATPAEAAGIRSGDVILSVNGHDVANYADLPRLIAQCTPGTRVKLNVLSNGPDTRCRGHPCVVEGRG
jgi:serine protease Do